MRFYSSLYFLITSLLCVSANSFATLPVSSAGLHPGITQPDTVTTFGPFNSDGAILCTNYQTHDCSYWTDQNFCNNNQYCSFQIPTSEPIVCPQNYSVSVEFNVTSIYPISTACKHFEFLQNYTLEGNVNSVSPYTTLQMQNAYGNTSTVCPYMPISFTYTIVCSPP